MQKPIVGRFDYAVGGCDPGDLFERLEGGKILVDGVEIQQVWYADTEAGVVKTYDVFRDGQAYATRKAPGSEYFTPHDFPGREVDCPLDGALSETLRGKVELLACPK